MIRGIENDAAHINFFAASINWLISANEGQISIMTAQLVGQQSLSARRCRSSGAALLLVNFRFGEQLISAQASATYSES